jgi:GAF domain-containing protein/anti-anti-sigma regulatory factor
VARKPGKSQDVQGASEVEQLTALNRVSQAVASSLEVDQVLQEIVSLIGEVVDSTYTIVVILDEEGSVVREVETLPDGVLDAKHRTRRDGHTDYIVRTRRAVTADDIAEDGTIISQTPADAPGTLNPQMVKTGIKSFAALPMIAKGRLLGVLFLTSLQPGYFHDRLPILTTYANQAAIALENARLFEATQARLRQVAFLNEVSTIAGSSLDLREVLTGIAGKMVEFFGVEHSGIVAREPGGERMYVAAEYPDRGTAGLEIATTGYPVADLVMQQGQTLAIEDPQNDPRMGPEQEWARELDVQSALFIPLIARDQVVGSIGLDVIGRPRHFDDEEIVLAQTVAAQIGMAVQNTRLFASIEAQNRQLQEEVAERQRATAERDALQQQLVEAHRRALRELSTPIIPIFEGIIAMPLIGSIDTMRVGEIMTRLLEGIDRYRAKVVILDITGVAIIDTSVADHLDKTIQAARLKGVHTIVTGIGNEVALTVVGLGIDWTGVDTLHDLQTGLMAALQRLGLRLSRQNGGS